MADIIEIVVNNPEQDITTLEIEKIGPQGVPGEQGPQGEQGEPGQDGAPADLSTTLTGFSPNNTGPVVETDTLLAAVGKLQYQISNFDLSGKLDKSGGEMTGALSIGTGAVAVSMPILNLSQTWNAAGVAFTAYKLNVTNTAAAGTSLLMDLQENGSSRFRVRRDGLTVWNGGTMGMDPGSNAFDFYSNSGKIRIWDGSGNADTILLRDAANTFAMRNGGTAASPVAQAFHLYNFYVGSTDFERGWIKWSGNALHIGTEKAGSGSNREMYIEPMGNLRLRSQGNASVIVRNLNDTASYWEINGLGQIIHYGMTLFGGLTNAFPALKRSTTFLHVRLADDSDYGGFIASQIRTAAYWISSSVGGTNTSITSSAAGCLRLANAAGNDFDRLQFGGTSDLFPALKRNGARLECMTADGTAYTPFACANLIINSDPPTSSISPGTQGEIATDDNYLYVCRASGWKRVALSAF